jgi:hypothetical protein
MKPPPDHPCRDCGKYFPRTADHFKKKKDGSLDTRCLMCRRDVNAGKRKQRKAQTLKDIEAGAVSQFMKTASAGGQNIPHSSELLERLMEYFGGTSGFSALLVKQFFDSPPGGAARTKMLETVVRLVTKNTEVGGAKKPLGQWTEDELEAELDSRLKLIARQYQGRIIDGTLTQETGSTAAIAVSAEAGELRAGAAEGDPVGAGGPPDRGPEALRAGS